MYHTRCTTSCTTLYPDAPFLWPLAPQTVALVSQPLHGLTGGLRTNGVFKLCMCGETGRVYQVLASTNLSATNWTVMGVMESTNGAGRYWDSGASTNRKSFYRAEQLP